jgi:hypothetical protein
MRPMIPLAVVALVLLAGCGARTQSARFVQAAPAPESQPISYFSTKMPVCDYEELGIVRGHPASGFTKLQQVLDGLAVEARRMGGHAIVGLAPSGIAGDGSGDGDTSRGLFGTVIRFTSSDCTT